ncbi:MAG: NAD(P)H-dependent glycerol-3-phosphate dehydrogenase [Alphaproteobacteria bacterium]|nr:NAD(P)H-dependent glycerol-3-phosphate dehydrogenase [Alphaproteobacteria bacterium]
MSDISVIGGGAWGTALAQANATKNQDVTLWVYEDSLASEINAVHRNEMYFPGQDLSEHIKATSELKTALKNDIVLLVCPAQVTRDMLKKMQPDIRDDHIFVLCSKGIELSTGKLMSDVFEEILPNTKYAVLTGPNFAKDIGAGKPAATTLACADDKTAKSLQDVIASPLFRPYISNDVIGVQVAGAFKNVIAIACGIVEGKGLGESARASLITRGLAEIARLGVAMGGQLETFLGLSGVGDMMLTCNSTKSRNFSLGLALGQGKTLEEVLGSRNSVTEGVHTAHAAVDLSKKYKVDMPICTLVYKCLHDGLSLDDAIHEMLNRPLGHEL